MTALVQLATGGRRWPCVSLALLLMTLAPGAQAPAPPADAGEVPDVVQFNRDVRPILSDKCYICHGPSKQMAGLRFDREEAAKQALADNRRAIVPGDADHSEMLRRIGLNTVAGRMPQRGEPLGSRDVAVLRRWIEQGAAWQTHWSFVPPSRPPVPAVADRQWVSNPDRRVRAGAARAGGAQAGAGSRPGGVASPRHPRSHRPAADAGRDRRVRRRSIGERLRARSSIDCWRRRATASAWRSRGSTRRATPTATATRPTASATCGAGATG